MKIKLKTATINIISYRWKCVSVHTALSSQLKASNFCDVSALCSSDPLTSSPDPGVEPLPWEPVAPPSGVVQGVKPRHLHDGRTVWPQTDREDSELLLTC